MWVARYCDLGGRTRYAKPRWHGNKASFARRRDAQRAIDEALAQLQGARAPQRIGDYFRVWLRRHPRSMRTDKTNAARISLLLGVDVEGRPLAEWEFDELRRRQAAELVDQMLAVEGRAAGGARAVLAAYSARAEDAIADDAAIRNAFAGIRISANDPRVKKAPRRIRIWSFEQMLDFAHGGRAEIRAATKRPTRRRARDDGPSRFYPPHDYEAVLLAPGFTGLRLGELLALRQEDYDGDVFHPVFTAHEGELISSSRQKNHDRSVPVPPTLVALIEQRDVAVDSQFLFPTPTGKLWRERNFYRDVWVPAKVATGLDPTPHEFRHSYVSNLRAAGIDDADLASVAGHTVETMVSVYSHALDRSHEAIRDVIG